MTAARRVIALRRPHWRMGTLLRYRHEWFTLTGRSSEMNRSIDYRQMATTRKMAVPAVRGAVRRARAFASCWILTAVVAHGGRKLYVGYGGKAGRLLLAQRALLGTTALLSAQVRSRRCALARDPDHAVGSEVLRVPEPLVINSAVRCWRFRGSSWKHRDNHLPQMRQLSYWR